LGINRLGLTCDLELFTSYVIFHKKCLSIPVLFYRSPKIMVAHKRHLGIIINAVITVGGSNYN